MMWPQEGRCQEAEQQFLYSAALMFPMDTQQQQCTHCGGWSALSFVNIHQMSPLCKTALGAKRRGN